MTFETKTALRGIWGSSPDNVFIVGDSGTILHFDGKYTLSVLSSNPSSGVPVTVSPPDSAGLGDGTTPLSREYPVGMTVTISAPATSGVATFVGWTGCDSAVGTACTVAIGGNRTVTARYQTVSQFISTGQYDGWVLESSETSGRGGAVNVGATSLYIGDDADNRQYRAILSFNTAGLPDNAVIVSATLRLRYAGVVGTNPFATHGALRYDIRTGAFSGNNALLAADFQAPASLAAAGNIGRAMSAGWLTGTLSSAALSAINKSGVTQIRLRHAKDDNNDHAADYLRLYSGNAPTASRPVLEISYSLP